MPISQYRPIRRICSPSPFQIFKAPLFRWTEITWVTWGGRSCRSSTSFLNIYIYIYKYHYDHVWSSRHHPKIYSRFDFCPCGICIIHALVALELHGSYQCDSRVHGIRIVGVFFFPGRFIDTHTQTHTPSLSLSLSLSACLSIFFSFSFFFSARMCPILATSFFNAVFQLLCLVLLLLCSDVSPLFLLFFFSLQPPAHAIVLYLLYMISIKLSTDFSGQR